MHQEQIRITRPVTIERLGEGTVTILTDMPGPVIEFAIHPDYQGAGFGRVDSCTLVHDDVSLFAMADVVTSSSALKHHDEYSRTATVLVTQGDVAITDCKIGSRIGAGLVASGKQANLSVAGGSVESCHTFGAVACSGGTVRLCGLDRKLEQVLGLVILLYFLFP